MDGHAIQIQAGSLHGRATHGLLRRVGVGQFMRGPGDFTEDDQPTQHLVVLYHPGHDRFVADLISHAAASQVWPGGKPPVKEDMP